MWYIAGSFKPTKSKYIAILLTKFRVPMIDFVYNVDGELEYLGEQDKTIFAVSDEDCSIFDSLKESFTNKTFEIEIK